MTDSPRPPTTDVTAIEPHAAPLDPTQTRPDTPPGPAAPGEGGAFAEQRGAVDLEQGAELGGDRRRPARRDQRGPVRVPRERDDPGGGPVARGVALRQGVPRSHAARIGCADHVRCPARPAR